MTDRRGFIKGAAAAAGIGAFGGCAGLTGGASFYGPTIRDRLWMWGHHAEMCHKSVNAGAKWPGPTVDQAQGCKMMGIPNNCVVRWGNMPAHPWGDYFEQFRDMKRITFSITDGAKGTVWEKLKIALEELKPTMPNLTGCFLDDYFTPQGLTQKVEDLRRISEQLHENDLRLSVVLYSDQDGFKDEFKPQLDLCDETSLWFWKSSNIVTMADNVKRCRDFIGPDKDLLLGLYMWDFTLREPVTAKRMEMQLEYARRFLADRTITGLIFHPTFAAALDVPAVNLSKKWIAEYGDTLWGV
jgi:hypothetical protein